MKRLHLTTILGLMLAPVALAAESISFDNEVRPLLNRCMQCHGPSKSRGGLRLDSKEAATATLDSGKKAIVPGKPELSELLRRVGTTEKSERMPPKGEPLTAAQVAKLRSWIVAGAHWPAHWAYRPLVRPPLPRLPASMPEGWARTPIDLFILEKIAARKLTPAPEADRRTLLRRVSFDLTGLPPTAEEVDAFLADTQPDAYERAVDRLLASPAYGERWARHWMDVVHFAETHGHDQDRPREHAWPYRDYLIRAFNEDWPYARFVREQVAGDVLFPGNSWATVATGFLATGPWDESSLRDIREDSIDREIARYLDRDDIITTVMSTFVSTTVHCARCHDHKFDPITQDEYYSLQAVFAATDKANRTYDPDPGVAARRRNLTERKARLAKQKETLDRTLLDPALQAEVAAWEKEVTRAGQLWQVLDPAEFRSAEGTTLKKLPDGSLLSGGKRPERDTYTVVAHTDVRGITGIRLEVLTDDSLPHHGPGRQDNGNLHLNEFAVTAAPRLTLSGGSRPPLARTLAWRGARADFDQQGWTIAHAIDGNPVTAWGIYPQVGKPHHAVFTLKEPLAHDNGTTLTFTLKQTHGGGHLIGRLRLSVTTSPTPGDAAVLPQPVAAALGISPAARTDRQRADLASYYLEQKLDREMASLPPRQFVYGGTSDFAPDGTFRPAGKPRPVRVLKRGDIHKPGALATPGTLSCVPGLESRFKRTDAEEGARRAALAAWLADPKNGLAWRSIANRIWQYHFGHGLVDTPNDFGRMGAAPTHPELLDWLAVTLRENGGSLKALHRLIVTSAVYRQSSAYDAAFAAVDGDNRYLWRMNRRRLDAEAIHDAVLRVSDKLDRTMGGASVKQFIQTPGIHVTPNVDYLNFNVDDPANFRRSVYRFVFRTLPDPFMESLDCPDGSQLTPVRSASVTALQALSMLNDKFMVRQSEHVAERIVLANHDPGRQVTAAYRLILGRAPTPKEARAVGAYAAKYGLANACRVLLNSNEFVFVD
ncbi:MAG: PSD1 domain-containing protein [Planctomycetes bacterium]|nr:PSD1 domain-containing protein [Planctomycetota bacterium]